MLNLRIQFLSVSNGHLLSGTSGLLLNGTSGLLLMIYTTSYLNVYFHAELLPHWKNIQRESLKFIDSLQIEENQVNASK